MAAHSLKRNPVGYVSLVDDPVINTPSHRVHAISKFDLTFVLHDGQLPVRLALEPNHDILHESFFITYLGNDGEVRRTESPDRGLHKVFRGRAFVEKEGRAGWSNSGWARITVHQDGKHPIFEGSFQIDGDSHHIHTGAHYRKTKHDLDPTIDAQSNASEVMVVYRDSDVMAATADGFELKRRRDQSSNCASDSLGFNSRYDREMRALDDVSLGSSDTRSLFGRQSDDSPGNDAGANYVPNIGSTQGCPTTSKVALVGIATDCTYWEEFDENREDLTRNVINMVNQASALYEDTFSISLGLMNLTIIDQPCSQSASDQSPWNLACSGNVNLNDRLNLFSSWRGRFQDENAYWTLLTMCNTESAVGLAWRGQLCREGATDGQDSNGSNESIAATNVVVRTSAEWQIFAHETGHTFGAVHDCTDSDCPVSGSTQPCCPLSANSCDAGGGFIMNPATGEGINTFSPCTIGNICSGLQRLVNSECLTDNRDIGTITGQQCGNGIVEPGEDCDCGGDSCESTCCNPDTCKFSEGSVCDPTNDDCCTDQCQFASAGSVCRASTGECDPEETCPGNSGSCPNDTNLDDGASCGDGLTCASGQCTSRSLQCRSMISDSNNNDDIEACGGDTCTLSCTAPSFDGQCAVYNQNFLDGTSCGGGGRCQSGLCEGGSTWGRIMDWLRENKNIAIPVGVVLAVLLLLAIGSCVWSCIRRCRRPHRRIPKPTAEMTGANEPPAQAWGRGQPYGTDPSQYGHYGGNVPRYNEVHPSHMSHNRGSTRYA
jgi:hypothetical protein